MGAVFSVVVLVIAGLVATAGTSQALEFKGGQYGSLDRCYHAINGSDYLKAHRSLCLYEKDNLYSVYWWEVGDPAVFVGGQYGRLDGCYDGINGDAGLKAWAAFCNFGSDRVYHIYRYGAP
jgi:hypothetical protein